MRGGYARAIYSGMQYVGNDTLLLLVASGTSINKRRFSRVDTMGSPGTKLILAMSG